MKTTLFLFCISLIFFSCSKDREIDKMGVDQPAFCGTTSLRGQEMDTSYICSVSDNNFSGNRYYKYFTLEQLQYCDSIGPSFVNPCISVLDFRNDTTVGHVERSDAIPMFSYQIEGDSVKLYHSDTINQTSFYVDPTCEQRLIARDGSKWFQY